MPMKQYPDVHTFPALITKIAEEFYGGSYYGLAKRMRRNPALIYYWRDGKVRFPRADAVRSIAKLHDLDEVWVVDLVVAGNKRCQ